MTWSLNNSRVLNCRANSSGIDYQISLWLPEGTPPAQGWPVIYVLDGNAMFSTFVEAIQRSGRRPDATGVGRAAVVGIAHGDERLFATEFRYRDFTFEPSAAVKADTAGGGRAFLDFISQQLAPELVREFNVNRAHQMLFGHSLAGYFVLNALGLQPHAFSHFAAISPSVWWQPDALTKRLQQLQASQAPRVLIATGEWEGTPAPWIPDGPAREQLIARRNTRAMLIHAAAVAALCQQQLGPQRVSYRCFPEEDHSSVVMIGIQRALRLMFEP
ncbi:alpha/beta hydrolase [Oceanimonas sp. CAM02]|uniref:alpha/beta hydrolase n=1 Tax=Oceanimonas sp. CAM02 TaxID=3080336 RepID=UPI002936B3C8|nr:alpha/beta hydrolase-fold protein [Oceanimonas sp. CAM02]MDV2858521.1 alpha/beta hydrolase-fold protein [Oceanimonas sp. CAM02]